MEITFEIHQRRRPQGWKPFAKVFLESSLEPGIYGLEITGLVEFQLNVIRVTSLIEVFFDEVFSDYNSGKEGLIASITFEEEDFNEDNGLSDETIMRKMRSTIGILGPNSPISMRN